MYVRPSPPFNYTDAHYNGIAQEINAARLNAGAGIKITKGSQGTTISLANPGTQNDMCWKGAYNFTSSYNVGDVVYIDATVPVTDENGDVIPFGNGSGSLATGSFICVTFVPALGFDDALLTGSVAPAIEAAGQQVTSVLADTFRHYDLNAYYPTLPLPPGATYVAESTWTTQSGSVFWLPIGGGGGSGSSIREAPVFKVYDNYTRAGGQITGIALTSTGSGFTAGVYSASITGGGGVGGAATYSASGRVYSITLTSPGYGYTGSPNFGFPSGSGAGASGSVAIAPSVYVALPRQLQRRTYDGQSVNLIDGPHTYSYAGPSTRVDTTPDPSSGTQLNSASIWPPYLPVTGIAPPGWNYINVYTPPGGTGLIAPDSSSITLMEIGTERRWLNQNEICYGNVTASIFLESNPTAAII